MKRLVALVLLASACTGDVDEPWFLDHDRIVAVRATPPRIDQGTSVIDTLVGHKGAPLEEKSPQIVIVVSPMALAGVLSMSAGQWVVTMPTEAQMTAARAELKLMPTDTVPLTLGVQVDQLDAVKAVILGDTAQNPPVDVVTINGGPAPADGATITLPKLTDVRLDVQTADTDEVNWLTSCGTMHDFDLAKAYVRVEKDDPTEGQMAVVVRNDKGGVGWHVWSCVAP